MIYLLSLLIGICSIAGLAITLYIAAGAFHVHPLYVFCGRMMPRSFRMTEAALSALTTSPIGRYIMLLLAAFGMVYYGALLIAADQRTLTSIWVVRCLSLLAIGLSTFLAMRRVNKRPLPLVLVLNTINGFLAALVWNLPAIASA